MGIVMIPDMTSNQIEISVQMPEDTDKEECYKRADQVLDAMTTIDGLGDVGAMAGGDTTLWAFLFLACQTAPTISSHFWC